MLETSVLALSGTCYGQLSVSFTQGIADSSYTGDSTKTDSDSIALRHFYRYRGSEGGEGVGRGHTFLAKRRGHFIL